MSITNPLLYTLVSFGLKFVALYLLFSLTVDVLDFFRNTYTVVRKKELSEAHRLVKVANFLKPRKTRILMIFFLIVVWSNLEKYHLVNRLLPWSETPPIYSE